MKKEWLDHSVRLSCLPADFYAGERKILRQRKITFSDTTSDLSLTDGGYLNGTKMSLLKKNYFNVESHAAALSLWQHRMEMKKYGSVSFTTHSDEDFTDAYGDDSVSFSTFNHYIKGSRVLNGEIPVDRGIGSVFGPCIQSVSITWLGPQTSAVDVFWRTTEWFRKFPADLILILDHLLPPFELKDFDITCHFANITVHPMTFISLIPSLEDPVDKLDQIKLKDPYFHKRVVKRLSRTLSDTPSKFGPEKRIRRSTGRRMPDVDWLRQYIKENK
jgi:hypothetical protein